MAVILRVAYFDGGLRAWARRNPAEAKAATREFLLLAGQLGVAEMRMVMRERFGRIGVRHPGLGPPTGQTAASVRATAPRAAFVDVAPHTPHAALVNDGSRPHVIRARRARSLRWTSMGQVRFARAVRHPGFFGHHFVERTAVRIRPRLERLAATVFTRRVTGRP